MELPLRVARADTGCYQKTERHRGCNSQRTLKTSEARHTLHPRKTHRARMHTRAKKNKTNHVYATMAELGRVINTNQRG
eukprot:8147806-Ditylum_brightwellii.AAC.2